MDIWKPALQPKFSAWGPSEPEVRSEVSFWKPSSESEGSVWIPASSESGGAFWKPSFESNWKPLSEAEEGSSVWKWPPSSESKEGSSVWKWPPSSEEEGSRIWKWTPSSESEEGSGIWKWKPSSEPKSEDDAWLNRTNTRGLHTSDEPIENSMRRLRRYDANLFRKEYKFEHGKKTCIWSNGIYSWPDKCYDSLWVAVHGMDSICMVTRHKDVDMTRVGSFYQRYCSNQQTLRSLAEAVISEVECLPYGDKRLTEKSSMGIEKPFGVVSVIPGTKKVDEESGHEDSSAEYDEEKAIRYLEEKMKSGSAFTLDETIQTAISGFQHLCIEELKAEDIWVTTWNGKHNEHLRLVQIKEHLDVISGVSPGGSGGGGSRGSGCSSTDSVGGPTDSGRPLNIFEILDSVAAAYKKLRCPCGSRVCTGNGYKSCEKVDAACT